MASFIFISIKKSLSCVENEKSPKHGWGRMHLEIRMLKLSVSLDCEYPSSQMFLSVNKNQWKVMKKLPKYSKQISKNIQIHS